MVIDCGGTAPSAPVPEGVGKFSLAEKVIDNLVRGVVASDFQTDRERIELGAKIKEEARSVRYQSPLRTLDQLESLPALGWVVDAFVEDDDRELTTNGYLAALTKAFSKIDEIRSPGGLVTLIGDVYTKNRTTFGRQLPLTPMERAPIINVTNMAEHLSKKWAPKASRKGASVATLKIHGRKIKPVSDGFFIEWHHDAMAESGRPNGHVAWVDMVRADQLGHDRKFESTVMSQPHPNGVGAVAKIQMFSDFEEPNIAGPTALAFVVLDRDMQFSLFKFNPTPMVNYLRLADGQDYYSRTYVDATLPLMALAFGDMNRAKVIEPSWGTVGETLELPLNELKAGLAQATRSTPGLTN